MLLFETPDEKKTAFYMHTDTLIVRRVIRYLEEKTTVRTDHLGLLELHGLHAALRVFKTHKHECRGKEPISQRSPEVVVTVMKSVRPEDEHTKAWREELHPNSWVPSQHAADSGLKVCARIEANIHNAFYGISTGDAFFQCNTSHLS